MHQFIKNLIAAAILFASLITSIALSYAISNGPQENNKPLEIKAEMKVTSKKSGYHFNDSLDILIPKVKS